VNATVIGGAASAAIADALAGPPRPASVLGAFTQGAYLLLPRGEVIALLTAGTPRLPNAVVIAGEMGSWREGDQACVGEHRVRLPRMEIRVVRWWSPRQVRPLTSLACLQRALAGYPDWPAPGAVRMATCHLGRAAAAADLPGVRDAAMGLVGLGPGLTPSGDDVLAGFLLGLRALDRVSSRAGHLAQACRAGAHGGRTRTTALAATLVRHAAAGEPADVAADLIDALAERTPVDEPLRALLASGHTSGRDLAEGLLLAWQASLTPKESARR